MEKKAPVHKDMEYDIKITAMGYEGEGIGKINDFTIFVNGALTGETVHVKIIKLNKNFGFGKLMDIIEASPERSDPMCSIYKRCGGCQLQHISYGGQLEFKRNRVKDCIERIGKLTDVTVHPTSGMNNGNSIDPFRYRNKVQLPVGRNKDKIAIGFYAPRSHNIVDVEKCCIQDEVADKIIEITRNWIESNHIEPYSEQTGSGSIRHIMIRKGFKTGEVMAVVVTNGPEMPFKSEYIKMLTENIHGIKSIVQNINSLRTNVILGEKCITLWGSDYITDYIGKFRFNISPLSFFQVNPVQTEVLYEKAMEYADLSGNETVFDAYCGTGTISLFLSQKAKKVYGVEIIPQAIKNAVENARLNNVGNAEFIVGKSEEVIPDLIRKGIKADVVVVDPPRKGCDSKLLYSIADMRPQKIVYVSCDPATLARDLSILDSLGFKTCEAQPVDMFPQTAHVEVVTLLTRRVAMQ